MPDQRSSQDDNSAPWSPDEFRELFAEIPAAVRPPLRRACNLALRDCPGLSRQDIVQAYQAHPETLDAATTLAKRIVEGRGR